MPKCTFSLDEETVARLKRLAKQRNKAQSLIVREAIARYGMEPPSYTPEEIAERVRRFNELLARIPIRPQADVDAELAEIRRARRHGGRRHRAE